MAGDGYDNIAVTQDGSVATVELRRPPYNYVSLELVRELADAFEALDADNDVRALVLAAEGRAFCAGGDFANRDPEDDLKRVRMEPGGNPLYVEAVRLFRTAKPIVAAVEGAAVGAGLGLSLVADFRVSCPEARFSANFTRLGFHPGFGLTATLPRAIGHTNAELMFMTSRRFKGEEARDLGLVSVLVPKGDVRQAALELATEISHCSPLGTVETRRTMRGELADQVRAATDHELLVQGKLRRTSDYREGVRAMADRRIPNFTGT